MLRRGIHCQLILHLGYLKHSWKTVKIGIKMPPLFTHPQHQHIHLSLWKTFSKGLLLAFYQCSCLNKPYWEKMQPKNQPDATAAFSSTLGLKWRAHGRLHFKAVRKLLLSHWAHRADSHLTSCAPKKITGLFKVFVYLKEEIYPFLLKFCSQVSIQRSPIYFYISCLQRSALKSLHCGKQ